MAAYLEQLPLAKERHWAKALVAWISNYQMRHKLQFACLCYEDLYELVDQHFYHHEGFSQKYGTAKKAFMADANTATAFNMRNFEIFNDFLFRISLDNKQTVSQKIIYIKEEYFYKSFTYG